MASAVMIKVDPKLFSTCRLCIAEPGMYQIVPTVHHQIKYCYDIDVQPFDGLPQLICMPCHQLLNKYSTTKKTIIEAQLKLKKMFFMNVELPQQDNSNDNDESNKRDISKSSTLNSTPPSPDGSIETFLSSKTNTPWQNGYKKQFICRICKMFQSKTKGLMLNHIKLHNPIIKKYESVIKDYCTVNLNKCDKKPNITGSDRRVVYSEDKIIDEGNAHYYIAYCKEIPKTSINDKHSTNTNLQNDDTKDENSDSSDQLIIDNRNRNNRKRRRWLVSGSSDETVIISQPRMSQCKMRPQRKSVDVQVDNECISIDGSDSADESDAISQIIKKKSKELETVNQYQNSVESKEIEYIIQNCGIKWMNKLHKINMQSKQIKANIESNLKHKILSIGRKIIKKKGIINCTGLLKYMEQKNLEIVWVPKSMLGDINKDNNFIRIMTKLKNKGEVNENDLGWVNISEQMGKDLNISTSTLKENMSPVTRTVSTIDSTLSNNTDPSSFPVMYKHRKDQNISLPKGKELLNTDLRVYTDPKNKLLNANPVSNPKKLPKKLITSEPTNAKTSAIISDNVENPVNYLNIPIISDITSLAMPNENTTNSHKIPNIPRIKVKPVSELMSESTLNRLTCKEPLATNNVVNELQIFTGNPQAHPTANKIITPTIVQSSQVASSSKQCTSNELPQDEEFIIMDTTELPNTKTNSPFEYLKHLLLIHNIVLLDSNEIITEKYSCLIKFRVQYKHESKGQPVIICLSLYSYQNNFCVKIKDRHQYVIPLNKVSANWQWEILKTYTGDVVTKMLQNAKKVSQEMYNCTNIFLNLLRTVTIKKVA